MSLRPLKSFCVGPPAYGLNVPAEKYVEAGVRFLRTSDIDADGQLNLEEGQVFLPRDDVPQDSLLDEGDILLSRSGTLGRTLLFREADGPATHAGYLVRFRPNAESYPGYLAYCCQSSLMHRAIAADAIQSTIGNFNAERYANVRLPWWPLREQRAIACFLDRETARIDALVAAKRQLVQLLEEARRALCETLVPANWMSGDTVRLGHVLREVDERLGAAPRPTLLSVSIHRGVIPFAEANPERTPRADDVENYKRCRPDDIVLNRMRAFQGGIGRASQAGIVSPDYAVLRPLQGAFSGYLNHLLRSPWFVGQMESRLRGIGGVDQGNVRTPRVNWDDLRTIIVPAPPLERQIALARDLDARLGSSTELQTVIASQLVLLQERRQSLITAAVTDEAGLSEVA